MLLCERKNEMIEIKQIQDFFVVLMAILGFISIVGGVINMFVKWKKESMLQRHDDIINDHEKRLQKLEAKTKEQEEFIHVLCNSILAIVSHEINGNSIDKLQKAKDDLENFLIHK